VGKTELTKALADVMFGDEDAMIRIDMSEYMERHSTSKLIGSPPGYVGYDDGGQLTEKIRRNPYSVVLFDEIEKAHPDVFNVLLQVLDDGRLTDNKGRVVNFKNTIIIMTSNLGSQLIRENCEALTDENREEVLMRTKNEVFEMLKQTIRPEFLNRIDELIMFTPLQESEIRDIVELQIKQVKALLERNGVELEVTEAAIDLFAKEGYDPQFGARPVKRVLQRMLLNELSKQIIAGVINTDKSIRVDVVRDEIEFSN
jgi:ATP-dependent Clp protease ATP-binding subunit ClpB